MYFRNKCMNYLYQLNKTVRLFKEKKKKKKEHVCLSHASLKLYQFWWTSYSTTFSVCHFLLATLTLLKCSQVSSIRNCKYINIIEQGCSCYISSLSLAADVRCKIFCKILLFYKRPAQYFNMLLEKHHDHQKEFILLWLVPMQWMTTGKTCLEYYPCFKWEDAKTLELTTNQHILLFFFFFNVFTVFLLWLCWDYLNKKN